MAVVCACASARAMGGHFVVDDATLVDPGEWEQETWYSRSPGGSQLVHAGVNVRAGPVEINGAAEHARGGGDPTATTWNLEVKWAHPVSDRLSVGLDVQPAWTTQPVTRYAVTHFYGIASWKFEEDLLLHVNAGRDWYVRDRDFATGGIALEWAPVERWTLIGERYLQTGAHFFRAGGRWSPSPHWSWDLSYGKRLAGPGVSTWTFGLNYHSDGH